MSSSGMKFEKKFCSYSDICRFNVILSRFLQLSGKNSAKIEFVFHFYHGFTSVVTHVTPLWGYSGIVTIFVYFTKR
jgi:hypothetical protein